MFVYFIHNAGTNHYKVGKTKSLEKRIKQLQTGNEVRLVIKRHIDDTNPEIEKYLHEYFKDKKILNEWFDITLQEIDYVIYLVNYANKLKLSNSNVNDLTDPKDIRLVNRILKWSNAKKEESKKDGSKKEDSKKIIPYSNLKRFLLGMLLVWIIMILVFKL